MKIIICKDDGSFIGLDVIEADLKIQRDVEDVRGPVSCLDYRKPLDNFHFSVIGTARSVTELYIHDLSGFGDVRPTRNAGDLTVGEGQWPDPDPRVLALPDHRHNQPTRRNRS